MDYVIRGPGDETLPELVAALRDRDHAGPPRIAGLSWKDGATIVHNPARRIPVSAGGGRLPDERLGAPRR